MSMAYYIFLMHDDANGDYDAHAWTAYIDKLTEIGAMLGGMSIGGGMCARQSGEAPMVSQHLAGYMIVTANGADEARALLVGNPTYESGGTVEIRELFHK